MRIFSSGGRGPSGGHDLGPDEVSARVVEVVEEAFHCGGGGRELGDPGQYSTVQVYRTGYILPFQLLGAVLALALNEPLLRGCHGQALLDALGDASPGERGGWAGNLQDVSVENHYRCFRNQHKTFSA